MIRIEKCQGVQHNQSDILSSEPDERWAKRLGYKESGGAEEWSKKS